MGDPIGDSILACVMSFIMTLAVLWVMSEVGVNVWGIIIAMISFTMFRFLAFAAWYLIQIEKEDRFLLRNFA